VLMFWLKPYFGAASWMAMACVFALAVTVYAVLMRAWALAVTGQIILFASLFEFGRQVLFSDGLAPAWPYALAPIAAFAGLPLLASMWLARAPEVMDRFGRRLNGVSQFYQVIAGLLSLAWIFEYIPASDRFWVLILVGSGLFLWAGLRKSQATLWASGVFAGIALLVFWYRFDDPRLVYVPSLLAIGAVMMTQQLARRVPDRFGLPAPAHDAVIILAGCSLGLWVSRWVLLQSGGFYLTVAWAVLALIIFTAGFILRERMYRYLGLAVLGFALGRVVIYDLWKLETLHRILSFMALGAVLLVLGFLYSKYQEKIRQWL
jgi:hypothetical protein